MKNIWFNKCSCLSNWVTEIKINTVTVVNENSNKSEKKNPTIFKVYQDFSKLFENKFNISVLPEHRL